MSLASVEEMVPPEGEVVESLQAHTASARSAAQRVRRMVEAPSEIGWRTGPARACRGRRNGRGRSHFVKGKLRTCQKLQCGRFGCEAAHSYLEREALPCRNSGWVALTRHAEVGHEKE